MKISGHNISKRLIIFLVSAITSAVIGIYISRLFAKKNKILISVNQTIESRQSIIDNKPNRFGPPFNQVIELTNEGELPLTDFTVTAYGSGLFDARLGKPWVPENYIQNCETVVSENSISVKWKCKLFNPGEVIRLGIDGSDEIENFTVTVRSVGITQSMKFKLKKFE